MKSVLILLATYNGEKYLGQQLESLFQQKNVQVSVLARDDGSKDGTKDILECWAKTHSLVWYTGEHLNVQFGFWDLMKKAALSDEKYFAFCDQDDVWDIDKLDLAVRELEKQDADLPALYYCGQRLVNENMEVMSVHTLNRERSLKARFLLSDIAGCTAVFNRCLLEKVISYRPEYMLMHDTWVLKVCLALGGNVIIDPEAHMNYRQHSGNTVGLNNSLKSKMSRAQKYIFEYNVEKQMAELKKGYSEEIKNEYAEIIQQVLNYKKNLKYKRALLDRKNIDFSDRGNNIVYMLKVCLNKL